MRSAKLLTAKNGVLYCLSSVDASINESSSSLRAGMDRRYTVPVARARAIRQACK